MNTSPKSFLPPIVAGIGLGLTLLAMFAFSGHGLGSYGLFRDLGAQISTWLAPAWTAQNAFLIQVKSSGQLGWISWELLGVGLGALLGSLVFRRFTLKIERGEALSAPRRLLYAFSGGVLAACGAALARGCTSGLGLSGSAMLVTGAFVFLGAFFVTGIVVSRYTRRYWQ